LQLLAIHLFICLCSQERIWLLALESNQADMALQLQMAAQHRADPYAHTHIPAQMIVFAG